jgi:hypothetical protein
VEDGWADMPQIAREEFERLPLRVHAFLAGVPLHDVWAVDLPRVRGGITLAKFLSARQGPFLRRPPPAVRALLSIRFFVGGLFGWDRATPGSVSESFAQRLTDEDRARSLAPAGTPDGLFRIVYRFENEQLDELINRTAHAGALSALVEAAAGYRFYFAVYVREVSLFTPLYMAAWAKKRLTGDEANLAGFCEFIATKVGAPLRIDGLQWIADAMKANPNLGKWFRDRTSNAFMEFLDVVVSEHATELSKNDKSRQALLDLAAHAVSRQLTAALALQERIRRVFRRAI